MDWHGHHAAIVGAENLIIADNMSDDPETRRQIKALAKVSTVFRFQGFHNRLSDRQAFAALWKALDDSCQWHIALDADERLAWVEDNRWFADKRLVERLMAVSPRTGAVPALQFDNLTGARDRVAVPNRNNPKLQVLPPVLWGKPAIAAGSPWPKGMPMHNIQFPPNIFAAGHSPNLVQLHLCNLVPEQRLRANREKLVARGICTPNTPFEEIAQINLRNEPRSVVHRCVLETQKLLHDTAPETKTPPNLHFAPDGHLRFSTPEVKSGFETMLREGGHALAVRKAMPDGGGWWGKS